MKVRTPYDRNSLNIKKSYKVLEVGSGHSPSFRSNVIAEKFIDSNYHRCGDVKIYPHQLFVNADGEALPFKDKEFDYVICNQVLEHVERPEVFLTEQMRVASGGYIETPSILGEFLFPKKSHKWVILDIDNKLVLYEKNKMSGSYLLNYGELFLNYLPYQSLSYKLLWLTEGNIMLNRYEWKDDIDFIINPQDDYYSSFFTQAWTKEMVSKVFPPRTFISELKATIKALNHLVISQVRKRMQQKSLLSLDEYLQHKNISLEDKQSI